MKVSSSIVLSALALPALAQLSERDLATIQNVISQIGTDLGSLDKAVQGFTANNVNALTTASSTLLSDIKQGTTTISNTAAITLSDAVMLQQGATSLQTTGKSLITNLEAKKTTFEQANLCDVVRSQVSEISTQSQNLINAVVSKVPQEAQTVASQLVSQFTTTLQQSEASFSSGNCTNSKATTGTTTGNGTVTTSTPDPVGVSGGARVSASMGALMALAAFAFTL